MNNPESLPPVTTGNNPAQSVPVLFAVTSAEGKTSLQISAPAPIVTGEKTAPDLGRLSRSLGAALQWGVNPDAKRKRSGKAAKRPGFAVWETIKWLAAAAIVWSIYGAIVFALMFYATR